MRGPWPPVCYVYISRLWVILSRKASQIITGQLRNISPSSLGKLKIKSAQCGCSYVLDSNQNGSCLPRHLCVLCPSFSVAWPVSLFCPLCKHGGAHLKQITRPSLRERKIVYSPSENVYIYIYTYTLGGHGIYKMPSAPRCESHFWGQASFLFSSSKPQKLKKKIRKIVFETHFSPSSLLPSHSRVTK